MKDTRLKRASDLMDAAAEMRSEAGEHDTMARVKREQAQALDLEAQALIDELIGEGA